MARPLNGVPFGPNLHALCPLRDFTGSLMKICFLKEDQTPESTSEEDRCA